MDKRYLKSIIDKYYLEGLIEQVLFKINDSVCIIEGMVQILLIKG